MVRWLTLLVAVICLTPVGASAGAVADTLTFPAILVNRSKAPRTVEVTITAATARLALMPGKVTEVFAFNGMVPGPTLEAREGDRVIVHFTNNLAEPTSIHWHGLHLPAIMDGSPINPVPPGGKRDYIFTLEPGTAGTYWYHPHSDVRTGYQVAKGLYGGLIIRAARDPLPAMPEKLLILSDNRFNPDGSLNFSSPRTPEAIIDEENGREGKTMLINGQLMPTIRIRSGEVQRWRIVNAGASRVYRLAIPGQTFVQVGTDGGLFERPVEVKEVFLSNSERVEVLVRGTGAPGSNAVVQNLPYDRYAVQTRPAEWKESHKLFTLAYSREPRMTPVVIPTTMRVIPVLDTGKATVRRTIVFSQGMINNRLMDMARVDVRAKLGATEIWTIQNVVGMDHPFHLHGYRFQVLDRNGVPERVRRWKDTINVPKHESVRFIVHFDANPGLWMFHCHILDHEDHGMMGILEIN
jgi:FtsP/CotA-like multicopper oxidase with cupredoxin domain